MHTVILGLGSNIGDRIEFIAAAIRAVADFERTVVDDVSGVYHTEPVGDVRQEYFLNLCVSVKTDLDPEEFHRKVKALERQIGRKRSERWGPREIDIDILLFDALIILTEQLTVPHREMVNRRFVLQPMAEIAPMMLHPVEKKSSRQMLEECTDAHTIEYSENFTSQLLALINDSIAHPTV